MPGNKYNGNSAHIPPTRVERLLRERELRKNNKALNLNETFEPELQLREDENSNAAHVERFLEGAAAARALNEGYENQDRRPSRQRLLVVANRLPVSAIRRGEDSWSLEMSAGGLVSALLGVKEFEARWIGWAEVNVPDEIGQKALTRALADKRCIPVFLDESPAKQMVVLLRTRAPQTALSWFTSLNISSCNLLLILVEFPRRLETGCRLTPNQYKSLCLFGLFVLSYFAVLALVSYLKLLHNRSIHGVPFATEEVEEISGSQPAEVLNLVQGKWKNTNRWNTIWDPLNGEPFIRVCEVDETGIQPFVESLSRCPKHGLHNPFKAPERYLMLGDISAKAGHMLSLPKVSDFFTRLIQRVAPKSYHQASGEVYVTQKFLENFSSDQVRFLARSFGVPGNHLGQQSHGFRWPYGPVAIITPLNFPLQIPVLQLMGALYMGNKPVLKVDSKVSIVMEQMLRLLHYCGLPTEDVDFINSDGQTMNKLLLEGNPLMTLFTGSSRVADKLAGDLKGRVKLEDPGFDWKILGTDVHEEDYVAWVCDQDAYACSGQKCSAQSMLFIHERTTSQESTLTKGG
ncbi:probable aldehyde dehydrogenase [Pyrus x bretschneideri]|uniref:probable aldehyde dehydrogenase n=1 Tax=Pyrus x bretschneideri TaxID=225117 RepID=UPI00202DFA3B|nr:probable aldehyde dehydrogenase [Pyrus x bretschneideri]